MGERRQGGQAKRMSALELTMIKRIGELNAEVKRLTQANIRLTFEKEVYEAAIISGVAIILDAQKVKP